MSEISARDRFRGCLLGLAAGDALGTTLEFKTPATSTSTGCATRVGAVTEESDGSMLSQASEPARSPRTPSEDPDRSHPAISRHCFV